jgi:NAD+ diphosphatase
MLQTPPQFIADTALPESAAHLSNIISLRFSGNELLVTDDGTLPSDSAIAPGEQVGDALVIGRHHDRWVTAQLVASGTSAPQGSKFAGLRSLFGVMADDMVAIAGRANQLLQWDRTHRFCGACGTATIREAHERARRCPACNLSAYPRISPAMMCLITRGKEILLARNVNFPAGRYSALAGFVEAGESIEDAVHREVREEVGVQVRNLEYFASQSWPFPHSLMIAFTAEYEGGVLTPNGHEIAEADWFSHDRLPQLPPKISIARALIEKTLARLRE